MSQVPPTTDQTLEKTKFTELEKTINPMDVPKSMLEVLYLAKTLAKSAIAGLNESEALTRILIGMQYGMDAVSACQNIYKIKDRYMAHYSVLLGKVKQHGTYRFKWIEMTDTRAEIEFFEKWGDEWQSIGTSSFTIEEARKAGTQNLEKWAKVMLAARAVGIGVRIYCADAFNGMVPYAQGEMADDFGASAISVASKSEGLAAEMQAQAEVEPIIEAEFTAVAEEVANDTIIEEVLEAEAVEDVAEEFPDAPPANPETGEVRAQAEEVDPFLEEPAQELTVDEAEEVTPNVSSEPEPPVESPNKALIEEEVTCCWHTGLTECVAHIKDDTYGCMVNGGEWDEKTGLVTKKPSKKDEL